MNKYQLSQVLGYLDAEYAGIVSRMTPEERSARAAHWAREVGSMDFEAVMGAVRKLARGQYMPRTAEVRQAVSEAKPAGTQKEKCRIFPDASGNEIVDLRYPDGSEWITGYLSSFPEWMQKKFRWMADPSEANRNAWDAVIMERETALMAMEGGAA